MNNNDIMEELSKSYLEVIANNNGYFNSASRDYGTDMTIRKATICPTRRRYLTTGKCIDIQIKAVSESYVTHFNDSSKEFIKYSLEVKNYNDLVDRVKENGAFIPLILAVFVMPTDRIDWIHVNPEELIVRKCAFWFKVPLDADYSKNTSNITIEIPKANKITVNFFEEQFLIFE